MFGHKEKTYKTPASSRELNEFLKLNTYRIVPKNNMPRKKFGKIKVTYKSETLHFVTNGLSGFNKLSPEYYEMMKILNKKNKYYYHN